MGHIMNANEQVRYEALVAVQKLMVNNWEYLGQALPAPKTGFGSGAGAGAASAASPAPGSGSGSAKSGGSGGAARVAS